MILTEEEKKKIDALIDETTELIDYCDLESYSYDPDPYMIGGHYSCSDNVSYDEEELWDKAVERLKEEAEEWWDYGFESIFYQGDNQEFREEIKEAILAYLDTK